MQRSEQVDKDIDLLFKSSFATWGNTFTKCESLIKENENTKADAVKLVVPDEIKKYQNILVESLTEKGLALGCLNDFLKSAFNAEVNKSMAVNYYVGAYYYWEYVRAYEYAQESSKYESQAAMQAREFKSHWDKYKMLKQKIHNENEKESI